MDTFDQEKRKKEAVSEESSFPVVGGGVRGHWLQGQHQGAGRRAEAGAGDSV